MQHKKEEGRDKYKKASDNIDKLLFWRESVDGIGLAYSQILQLTYVVWVGDSQWGTWLGLVFTSSSTTFPKSLDFFLLLIF